jgi:hypothetical protein
MEFEERLQSYLFFDYTARNWGHHVRGISMSGDEEILALNLLESQGNISASSQGMLATKLWERHPDYRQQVPLHVTGLHLAANFWARSIIGYPVVARSQSQLQRF